MSNITGADVTAIVAQYDTIRAYAQRAVELHRDAIMREYAMFDAYRARNSQHFAVLCAVSAVLSNQAELRGNLRYAYELVNSLDVKTSVDFTALRKRSKYNGMNASVKYALAAYDIVSGQDITQWLPVDFLQLTGIGPKIARWAIAPFNPAARCITLDRHMIAYMCDVSGIGKRTAFKVNKRKAGKFCAEYDALEQMFLDIADELGELPFTVQWAVWNEWRHAGEHATHVELIGIDPDAE